MAAIAGNRWIQLIFGILAMVVISNYQYAFTLFTPGMKQTFTGVPYAKIAAVFSAFILFETWPMPVAGYFVDKFGIRKLMSIGAIFIALGWVLGGTIATSPLHLYIYYGIIAGTGAGIIYISCVANAVKWFPDKRGLAVGLTAAGFGGGAALAIMPIAATIHSIGWAKAMAFWGIGQGIIALLAAMILRHPPAGWAPPAWTPAKKAAVVQSKVNFTWMQTLSRPEFYLLYAMFFFACAGGLIATANLSQIAKALKVSDAKVWGMAIVPAHRDAHFGLQRAVANPVGHGFRSPGTRAHHVPDLRHRSHSGLCRHQGRRRAVGIRGIVLVHFSLLGRNLFPVLGHDRRHLRSEERLRQLRHGVHIQRPGFGVCRIRRCGDSRLLRRIVQRAVLHLGGAVCYRSGLLDPGFETVDSQPYRE